MLKERSRCHFTAPRVNREKHTNLMTVRVGDMLIVKTFLYKLVYTLQETVHFNLKSISRLLTWLQSFDYLKLNIKSLGKKKKVQSLT